MSYDIDLIDKYSGHIEEFNITWNVSGMFYSLYPAEGIRAIYGLSGKDSLDVLIQLYRHLVVERERMLKFEPENGWGSWETTVKTINKMCITAAKYPNAVWQGD